MKSQILIPLKTGEFYDFNLNILCGEKYIIDLPGICYFRFFKYNDHRYIFEYFVYNPRRLGFREFSRKKELISAVQNLIKEFL